jgi:Ca2+-transporting ATPase
MMRKDKKYQGLTQTEVIENRKKYGANVLTPPEKESLLRQFLEKFSDPLIIILLIAGLLSVGISCYEFFGLKEGGEVFFEPVGIFLAILLATGLSFYFESKANKEFNLLNQVNDDEPVRVIRDGNATEIKKRDVVVGDIVLIDTGQEIPADGVLLEAVSLNVDESSLTGEPTCRKSTHEADFDKEATYPTNHVMRGTNVLEGHGVFRVTAVGDHTENGKVYKAAQIDDSVKTPLNEQLSRLGGLITNLSYIVAALVIVGKLLVFFDGAALAWTFALPVAVFFWLVIKKFKKMSVGACAATIVVFFAILIAMVIGVFMHEHPGEDFSALLAYSLQTIMIAVTLIVVAVPEGLPMAVTLSLAYSMRNMLKTNNLVRKMHACETMGAATVICTDKTGTLTQNQMQVSDCQFYGIDADDPRVGEGIAVNSTALLDLSDSKKPRVLGNPTEGALLLWLRDKGVDYLQLREGVETLQELPFSTRTKYMATVVRNDSGKLMLYVKGAPEIVFSLCKSIGGGVSREEVEHQLIEYQNHGMRTLGFAMQELTGVEEPFQNGQVVAKDLQFIGIMAIADPVRKDVPQSVSECLKAGIHVKIVTGDTPGTAKEIGRQIGIWSDSDGDENIITGPELAALSDKQLQERAPKLKIIARARPEDKLRLVKALQTNNEVVAVTGDGTNDAPALNAAQVGLSMGSGTNVAKEASDITIIDDSFSSIGRAVMWGRSLYENIQRFILFQLTVNVAACLIVLAGAFLGKQSPLTVTQMLWVNLIMDTFAAMALASLPPSPSVMKEKPRDRHAFIISRTMGMNILGVGGMVFVICLAMVYIFDFYDVKDMTNLLEHHYHRGGTGMTDYELSLFFTVFVMLHFWYMFCARAFETGKSIFRVKYSTGFWTINAITLLGQILIVEVLYKFFNVTPLLFKDWVIIIVATSLVVWVRELHRAAVNKLGVRR